MEHDGANAMNSYCEQVVEVRRLLSEVLELMRSANITAMASSAEAYVDMVEKRAVLLEQLTSVAANVPQEALQDKEFLKLSSELRELHNKQNMLAEGIMRELRKSIKDVRTERTLSDTYGDKGYSAGMLFDKTH